MNKQLVAKIERFFKEGMVLSNDVLHFIDSTFSNPSLREFGDILKDESNLERESLIELLFSPDKSIQVQLENLLIRERFEKNDEEEIIDLLCSKKLNTHIIFPDSRGRLKVNISDEAMASFVSKLNIYWKPDILIIKTIDKISEKAGADNMKSAVTVRMRNRMVHLSEMKTHTLCSFLKKVDIQDPSFFNCFDYLLDIMDGVSDADDIYEVLSQRKHQYSEYIRRREEFESLLANSNLETLSLQGINAPFINVDDMRKRIAIIDTITLAVYGKIVYCL